MGSFNATCAITRTTILWDVPVVCIRVDTRENTYFSAWDEIREGTVSGVVGVWFGKYDTYGSVEEAPKLESKDYEHFSDILILRTVWDRVVKFEREKYQRRMEETTPDPRPGFEPGPNELIRSKIRAAKGFERMWARFDSRLSADERREVYEKVLCNPDPYHDIVRLWPIWSCDLGYILHFAYGARINLLAAARTWGQHNEIERFEFLAEVTADAIATLKSDRDS